jgi:hypothetical protein
MSVLKSDAAKAKARQAPLVKFYRSIGPAHILAAVLASKKGSAKLQPAKG